MQGKYITASQVRAREKTFLKENREKLVSLYKEYDELLELYESEQRKLLISLINELHMVDEKQENE